jgi:hypothetical protein
MHTDTQPETSQVAEEKKPETTEIKLARAMQFCADVAKLYKKYGSPKNYQYAKDADGNERKTSGFNHGWKRNILQSAWRKRPAKHAAALRCASCGLWFVGPAMVRCQCKVAPKAHKEES